jgi:hypothetical protein
MSWEFLLALALVVLLARISPPTMMTIGRARRSCAGSAVMMSAE